METRLIKNSIHIVASAPAVWDCLTNPGKTKIYMFGCEAISGWQPGDSLTWEMIYEGRPFVAVKGTIVEIIPGKYLAYTVFDPNGTLEDVIENYLTVTYSLQDNNGQTTLTVTQGDYNKVGDGERRYQEAWNNGEGWMPILEAIKKVAEGG